MPVEEKKPFVSFNFKDLLWFVALIMSVASTFFTQRSRIEKLEIQVSENSTVLKDNNLELIVYKIDEQTKKINDIQTSVNRLVDNYNH